MVGCILTGMKQEQEKNQNIFNKIDEDEESDQEEQVNLGLWGMIKSIFSCSTITPQIRYGCYVMTIGVIDECRQCGIGTLLLNQINKAILMH